MGFRIHKRFSVSSSALAARLRGAQTQRPRPALLLRIPRGAAWTVVGWGLPGEGPPREKGLRAGPRRHCAGRPRVSSCTSLAWGGFNAPSPPDFRSSIMDSGEFLPGLKGITQIAETWLSGSGRNSTRNRYRNFSQTEVQDFVESVLGIWLPAFHSDSRCFCPGKAGSTRMVSKVAEACLETRRCVV